MSRAVSAGTVSGVRTIPLRVPELLQRIGIVHDAVERNAAVNERPDAED